MMIYYKEVFNQLSHYKIDYTITRNGIQFDIVLLGLNVGCELHDIYIYGMQHRCIFVETPNVCLKLPHIKFKSRSCHSLLELIQSHDLVISKDY